MLDMSRAVPHSSQIRLGQRHPLAGQDDLARRRHGHDRPDQRPQRVTGFGHDAACDRFPGRCQFQHLRVVDGAAQRCRNLAGDRRGRQKRPGATPMPALAQRAQSLIGR